MPSSAQLAGRRRKSASRVRWILLALALIVTLLNAVKPLHMDDPFIYRVAEQVAAHPADPYGFDIFWLQWPQPVAEELTPPVLPYWWAIGLRLFGERPWLWKLWLFPFAALLSLSLHALARRFAPRVALPLVAATVLSPAFLPGFNLMQDIPAMALGLSALELYLRAAERGALRTAAAAGLLAGLATQTKYTTVGVLGAIALHAVLARRVRPAAVTLGVCLTLFFGWEALMTATYGQGMFFGQVRYGLFWYPRLEMILPLLRLVGATAAPLLLWCLGSLGLPRAAVAGLGGLILAAYGTLLWWPIERGLFFCLGVGVVSALAVTAWHLHRAGSGLAFVPSAPLFDNECGNARPDPALFLVLWFLIEVGVYFATSPFPAVRRVLGVVVVATLLAGCAASRRLGREPGSIPALGLAAATATLGLLFQYVDFLEARAQQTAVTAAAETIRGIDARPKTWYVGHWGFQHYAERAGMHPVVPDVSRLERGDWLVVPREVHQQEIRWAPNDILRVQALEAQPVVPLTTGHGYYGESVPLAHLSGARLTTEIFRVQRDLVPPSSWPPRRLADWALRAGGRTAAAAVPALIRALSGEAEDGRQFAAQGLGAIGELAGIAVPDLAAALADPHPGVRYWAADALGKIGSPAAPAVPALERGAADPDAEVRRAIQQALTRIRGS